MASWERGLSDLGQSGERLRGLDTLRAFAILAVMGFHLSFLLPAWARPPLRFGWIGVDLFFVLSGYLIASQLFRPHLQGRAIGLRSFYTRRLYRILPAYLTVLALYLFVPQWREDPHMSPAWEFFSFTENLFVNYSVNHAFSHVWSLCVEEHFYLFLPWLTVWLLRKPAAWKTFATLAAFVCLGLVLRSYVLFHVLRPLGADDGSFGTLYIERIYYPTYTRLDGLIAGVSLAALRTFRPAWWSALQNRGNMLLTSGVSLVAFACWTLERHMEALGAREIFGSVLGYPLLALGLALTVASALTTNGLLKRLSIPGAEMLATLAFSLYLSHKAVVHVAQQLLPGAALHSRFGLVIYAGCCLGFAGLLYGLVERPFLALRDRQRSSGPAVPLAVQARRDPAL